MVRVENVTDEQALEMASTMLIRIMVDHDNVPSAAPRFVSKERGIEISPQWQYFHTNAGIGFLRFCCSH